MSQFKGIEVSPRPGEDGERLIRRWMRQQRDAALVQEVVERTYYLKPCQERRRKRSRAAHLRSHQ
jgi:ribosomal protein S21